MRDYSQNDMAQAVSRLWNFWRDCSKNGEVVEKKFEGDLKSKGGSESSPVAKLDNSRRRVSHFYQRMAGLYAISVLPGSVLYRHWQEKDLRIIPEIIIPMEEALMRSRGEDPGNESEPLEILYGESDIDGIRRTWRRLRRRLSSVSCSVRAFVTGKPLSEVRTSARRRTVSGTSSARSLDR